MATYAWNYDNVGDYNTGYVGDEVRGALSKSISKCDDTQVLETGAWIFDPRDVILNRKQLKSFLINCLADARPDQLVELARIFIDPNMDYYQGRYYIYGA